MVRETGLEPVRDYHTPLKRARLPIPPLSHSVVVPQGTFDIISDTSAFVNCFFAIKLFFDGIIFTARQIRAQKAFSLLRICAVGKQKAVIHNRRLNMRHTDYSLRF